MENKQSRIPNWLEADQLAFYTDKVGEEFESRRDYGEQIHIGREQDLSQGPPDIKKTQCQVVFFKKLPQDHAFVL